MQEPDIREEINIIRSLVEKSRRSTIESGGLFVFWGILIIAAMAATMILEHFGLHHGTWLAWTAAVAIGWVFSFFYGLRRARSRQAETYAGIFARHIGLACGTGFLLACFVFPLLNVYPPSTIPMAFSLIAGIFFFVLGGLYEWNLMKWIGLLWWLGSIGLALLAEDIRNPAFLGLFIAGYFVPSLVIWRKHRSELRGK